MRGERARGVIAVHLDERERSVTVTARYPGLPDDAPGDWAERRFNSWEEHTVHTGVSGLRCEGWDFTPLETWETEELPGGRSAVTLAGPGGTLRFEADAATRRVRRGLRSGAF